MAGNEVVCFKEIFTYGCRGACCGQSGLVTVNDVDLANVKRLAHQVELFGFRGCVGVRFLFLGLVVVFVVIPRLAFVCKSWNCTCGFEPGNLIGAELGNLQFGCDT